MNVVATNPRQAQLPLYFNVGAHVGNACPNVYEDVLLVQYLMRKAAENNQNLSASRKTRILKVPTSGKCDAATVDGIIAMQEHLHDQHKGTVVDGRISPARGSGISYGSANWLITIINASVRKDFSQAWPRIDLLPDCPAALKPLIKTLL